MTKSFRISWISFVTIAGALFISYALITQAVSKDDIVYPATELGGCKDETDCRAYCEKPANLNRCLDFAEKHNLMSREELGMAKKFAATGSKGPGGCNSKEACETYCNDVSRMDQCLAFAEQHGFMPEEELKEARKIQSALAKGAKLPGGCKNKNECETYCQDSSRMEECLAFAEAAGFMDAGELEEARRIMPLMLAGQTPGGCRSKEQCEAYCEEEGNFEACIDFGAKAGLIPPEHVEIARKTGGKGPGGCRGRQCMDFCEKEENLPVCIDFAIANGMMKPEEAEMARKTGGKGPGGCKGREACEAFCNNPDNQEGCFDFANQHGLLKEEDLQRMQEGSQQIQGVLGSAPPQVLECLDSTLGAGSLDQLRSGDSKAMMRFGSKMEGAMQTCFMQAFSQGQGGEHGGPPGGFPGGAPPGDFPGQHGEFPGAPGQFPAGGPSPEQIEQLKKQFEGGAHNGASSDQVQQQIQQQIQQQYQQQLPSGTTPPPTGAPSPEQIQQQVEQQIQQQIQQQLPSGTTPPPGATYPTPSGDTHTAPPPEGSYTAPPSNHTPPPSSPLPPPPSSSAPRQSLLGRLLQSFLNLFK